jgi:hypothetical protein
LLEDDQVAKGAGAVSTQLADAVPAGDPSRARKPALGGAPSRRRDATSDAASTWFGVAAAYQGRAIPPTLRQDSP